MCVRQQFQNNIVRVADIETYTEDGDESGANTAEVTYLLGASLELPRQAARLRQTPRRIHISTTIRTAEYKSKRTQNRYIR